MIRTLQGTLTQMHTYELFHYEASGVMPQQNIGTQRGHYNCTRYRDSSSRDYSFVPYGFSTYSPVGHYSYVTYRDYSL
ncbi:hypothetical protein LWI29_000435 [Acer saccharum]|uniref:Uncharacterized protein n=1 Tax=Acer saccharum TaxID=4024 RepID=A0AA39VBG5_ACESA|nr:hypothetical protein LWI29_000435 [Acer saccharum]